MIFALGFFSIVIGLFILSLTIAGDTSNAGTWILGIAFLAFGIGAPALAIYNENQRQAAIRAREGEWGKGICDLLIAKRVQLEMTQEMVRLSWGMPSNIDQKEIMQKGTRERWVYGQPRKGANYVWFTNGKVSKIKT